MTCVSFIFAFVSDSILSLGRFSVVWNCMVCVFISKLCLRCSFPVEWDDENVKWIPINIYDGGKTVYVACGT